MATLEGATIASTFKSLLKLSGNTDDLAAASGANAVQVVTGDGDATLLYLNTNKVGINTTTVSRMFEVKDTAKPGYKYIDKIKKYRKITGQDTALLIASGNVSNLSAVVVCFNPKFGGGRFGTSENEHFLQAANVAIKKKVDLWIVIYQSSGIDVHAGVTALTGMTKSVIAMNEIKKAGIPTFAVAARAVAGGTYASSFFMHDFIMIESKCVENLLFSGKRVTENILKGTDQIPDDFGTGPGVMKSGLADMTLESRKELKNIVTKLANIILKKEKFKSTNVEEAHENPEDFKKTASTTS